MKEQKRKPIFLKKCILFSLALFAFSGECSGVNGLKQDPASPDQSIPPTSDNQGMDILWPDLWAFAPALHINPFGRGIPKTVAEALRQHKLAVKELAAKKPDAKEKSTELVNLNRTNDQIKAIKNVYLFFKYIGCNDLNFIMIGDATDPCALNKHMNTLLKKSYTKLDKDQKGFKDAVGRFMDTINASCNFPSTYHSSIQKISKKFRTQAFPNLVRKNPHDDAQRDAMNKKDAANNAQAKKFRATFFPAPKHNNDARSQQSPKESSILTPLHLSIKQKNHATPKNPAYSSHGMSETRITYPGIFSINIDATNIPDSAMASNNLVAKIFYPNNKDIVFTANKKSLDFESFFYNSWTEKTPTTSTTNTTAPSWKAVQDAAKKVHETHKNDETLLIKLVYGNGNIFYCETPAALLASNSSRKPKVFSQCCHPVQPFSFHYYTVRPNWLRTQYDSWDWEQYDTWDWETLCSSKSNGSNLKSLDFVPDYRSQSDKDSFQKKLRNHIKWHNQVPCLHSFNKAFNEFYQEWSKPFHHDLNKAINGMYEDAKEMQRSFKHFDPMFQDMHFF
jgi:hypothetical protein